MASLTYVKCCIHRYEGTRYKVIDTLRTWRNLNIETTLFGTGLVALYLELG